VKKISFIRMWENSFIHQWLCVCVCVCRLWVNENRATVNNIRVSSQNKMSKVFNSQFLMHEYVPFTQSFIYANLEFLHIVCWFQIEHNRHTVSHRTTEREREREVMEINKHTTSALPINPIQCVYELNNRVHIGKRAFHCLKLIKIDFYCARKQNCISYFFALSWHSANITDCIYVKLWGNHMHAMKMKLNGWWWWWWDR
jgi:hypothetical protein